VLLIIGEQLAWGNQSTYIASYFHYLGNDVNMEEFYTVQPLIVSTATFFFPLAMHLCSTVNPKL